MKDDFDFEDYDEDSEEAYDDENDFEEGVKIYKAIAAQRLIKRTEGETKSLTRDFQQLNDAKQEKPGYKKFDDDITDTDTDDYITDEDTDINTDKNIDYDNPNINATNANITNNKPV